MSLEHQQLPTGDGKTFSQAVHVVGPPGAAPAPAALPANAATETTLAQLAADTAAIRARQYDRFGQQELQPGDSLTLPAGTYHSVSFSVTPANRTAPNFGDYAKVSVGAMTARYFGNEYATHTATELAVVDFSIGCASARALVTWSF